MNTPQCRYCGQHRRLIKAHIIPEAFFRKERAGAPALLMVTGAAGVYPKRSPIGVYDPHLLCATCEKKFDDLDSYAAQILLRDFDQLFTPMAGLGAVAYESRGVDQDRLLRFLVSLAWRASASTERFYNRVDLGRHEQAAKDAVEDRRSGVSNVFGALLSFWPAAQAAGLEGHGLMDPFREKWDGVNAYRFSLGRVVAYIKVDRRPFAEPLASLALGSNEVLRVIERDFLKSHEYRALVRTAKQSRQNERAGQRRTKLAPS